MTFSGSHTAAQQFRQSRFALHLQQTMQAAPAQVAIHQQHAGTGESQGAGQVGGDGGFPLARHGAGDQQDFGPLPSVARKSRPDRRRRKDSA